MDNKPTNNQQANKEHWFASKQFFVIWLILSIVGLIGSLIAQDIIGYMLNGAAIIYCQYRLHLKYKVLK